MALMSSGISALAEEVRIEDSPVPMTSTITEGISGLTHIAFMESDVPEKVSVLAVMLLHDLTPNAHYSKEPRPALTETWGQHQNNFNTHSG